MIYTQREQTTENNFKQKVYIDKKGASLQIQKEIKERIEHTKNSKKLINMFFYLIQKIYN